ncbi:DUF2057 domain-containing protein [Shewanella sp.]|uniref:DUF2057 domain-containing protein n=1 Tax=Shewanella sp. TaxID=50422 RepID=UPI004053FD89
MKLFQTAGALLILASSSAVFAANLTIPMSFEYLALDGKNIATNKFTHQEDLPLTAGSHKIALRYHDLVKDDFSDSQTFVKSSPIILTLVAEEGKQYLLSPVKSAIKDPKNFAKEPKLIISSDDNQAVDFSITQTQIEEKSFFGQLFTNKSEPVIASATQAAEMTIKPEAIVPATTPTVTDIAPTAMAPKADSSLVSAAALTAPATVTPNEHAQKMLQHWWLQADEATQKEFMSWAIKQL